MSITDELREYARHYSVAGSRKDKTLTAIADRIDEWNKADVCCEYTRGYTTGFSEASVGTEAADELRERIDREYIKAPVDADGKVIHVEDEVELLDGSKRFKAEWLEWDGDGWAVHSTEGYGAWHEPSHLRHYHAPTVEDVLREFAQRWDDPVHYAKGELVEQYAAKLRLAGDE